MLDKDEILSLRDLALDHLPKVRAERDRMEAHERIPALRVVAFAPLKTLHSAASTAIEKRAAVLLEFVHQHPHGDVEWIIPPIDNSENALAYDSMEYALKDQPKTEVILLETARQLCKLSGAALPPWMTVTAPAPAARVEAVPVKSPSGDANPWLVHNQKDPDPHQPWYTPARYFARQLVKGDSTLLTKKELLGDKVAPSLAGVGIFKRGKTKKKFEAGTILKAFSNVSFD